jgi:hypothetical protein
MQASLLSSTESPGSELAAALAHRHHVPDERQLRATAGALSAAVTIAIDDWQRDGGKADLLSLFDQTVDALATGIGELQPRTPPQRASDAAPRSRSATPSRRRAQSG